MTCPFCGAAERQLVCEKIYECGSSKLWQSKPCQELCRLREKKAKGLKWELIGECLRAKSVLVEFLVFMCVGPGEDSYVLSCLDENPQRHYHVNQQSAKAHAEELHQQAWRELRNKWDAK